MASGETISLFPGRVLGTYRLIRQLGGGTAAEVWLAAPVDGGEEVALKCLRADRNPNLVRRAEREARLLAELQHPFIARGRAGDFEGPHPFLVLEHVPGVTLAEELGTRAGRRQQAPLRWVLRVLGQVAAAISYAHQRGAVHRDLKPSNVMLSGPPAEPLVKVLDFGIAYLNDPDGFQTENLAPVGAAAYTAPEQARGDLVDGRADVFSLGVLLFEMLTSRRAFVVESSGQLARAYVGLPDPRLNGLPSVVRRIQSGLAPRPSEWRALPPAIDAVVTRALAPHPHRFPTAEALHAAAIEALCDEDHDQVTEIAEILEDDLQAVTRSSVEPTLERDRPEGLAVPWEGTKN